MKAQVHPHQSARISALQNYEILDTDREHDFDEIVELASQICEVPISVINFIDQDRQWFKAEVGLGVRETPLDTSVCSHVILDNRFVQIPDTLADARMADNPLCKNDPGLRFYAGAQLLTDNGLPLGTLCVLDYQPRELTDLQRKALEVLSRQVMTQLDLRVALRQQVMLNKEIDHRVKNSLQSISSIVRLQARKPENQGSQLLLDELQRRIGSVALLHEELHKASSAENVDLERFMGNVVAHLAQSASAGITIKADFEPIRLSSHLAVPLSLIINEFAANSIKHAFADGDSGTIGFTGRVLPGGDIEVLCWDDGIGMKPSKDPAESTGLGLTIIEGAAAQLSGHLTRDHGDDGTKLSIQFTPA